MGWRREGVSEFNLELEGREDSERGERGMRVKHDNVIPGQCAGYVIAHSFLEVQGESHGIARSIPK